mgnify:CR=1 FL=1
MSTETQIVEVPQAQQAARIAEDTYQVALAYTVDSPEMYALATDELRNIATRKAQLNETRLSLTRPLDESKKRIMDLFRAPLEKLDEADRVLRGAALEWKRAEDARIAAERAEAERQAREERERIEAERRAAEEAERQARAAADAAMAAGNTEAMTAALVQAEQAADAREQAEEKAELAEVAPAPAALVQTTAKAAGVSGRVNWKAEVVDLAALVTGAAEALARGDDSLLAHLLPNTTSLGQVAKALKGAARIPGVRVYAEESLAVRRR